MLDIHILHCGETTTQLNKCKKSLPKSAVVNVLPGIDGGIGQARTNGFLLGSNPFVSFADPDDVYVPEVFDLLVNGLLEHPECSFAYAGEYCSNEPTVLTGCDPYNVSYHFRNAKHVHGVLVFRRSLVVNELIRISPFRRRYPEWVLTWLMLTYGVPLRASVAGRTWNMHEDQAHRYCVAGDTLHKENIKSIVLRRLARQPRTQAINLLEDLSYASPIRNVTITKHRTR